ncbi:MBL fold metallo-hydrolase [Duganella sp. FT50W]|uniref:MBL fold metallo-hydrolase n=1 Tax=Duganella lactea TaxID=2692173 RepID=A0A6L8MEL1_9BURK|nr:MBL fold metallo-hydrolase [Duganella lactea]MYM80874.1 MBL fold metallo-hydrolase [Duganella lactea]
MNRREMLACIASTSAITLFSQQLAFAQTRPLSALEIGQKERFRRVRLGDVEVVALYDGVTHFPLNDQYVSNAPFQEVLALVNKLGLSTTQVELPFTGFLVISEGRRILLDTGLGEFGTPRETTGGLVDSLKAAGFKPEDIDTVLITHFHPDHISGLRNRAGEFVYPNAKVWVAQREYDFWMSASNMRAAPERKTAFELAQRVFTGMPDTMLIRYEPGHEVAPGILSVPAYGHTPGHTTYTIRNGSRPFHYIGDMINVPAVFALHPEWSVATDMDPASALSVRHHFLETLDNDALVGGFHFPFPAIGSLVPLEQGFRFVPFRRVCRDKGGNDT